MGLRKGFGLGPAAATIGMLAVAFAFVAVAASPAAAAAKVQIRFAAWAAPGEYDEIIDAFEKANPDVQVKFEPTSWGAYWTQLQAQIAAGRPPDVVRMSGAYLLNFAADGALEPLDEWIKRDNLDMSRYFNTGDILRFDEQIYGLPEFGDIIGIYYNLDRFEEAAISPPSQQWTWADLATAARKLTVRVGDQTKSWGLLLDLFIGGNGQTSWVNFLLQNGTRALSDDKRRALFDQPAAIEAVQFLANLYQKERSIPSDVNYVWESFTQEKVAMMYALVPIGIPIIAREAKFRWDLGPAPRQKRFASQTNFVGFCMMSQSKQKEAAWRFLKFLAGPEAQTIIARKRQGIPALKSAALSPEFLRPGQPPLRLGEVLQVTLPNTFDLQFTPGWAVWTAAADSQISQAVRGLKSVEAAMKTATDEVNQVLEKGWKELENRRARAASKRK